MQRLRTSVEMQNEEVMSEFYAIYIYNLAHERDARLSDETSAEGYRTCEGYVKGTEGDISDRGGAATRS
jgi:hypothetical protein